MTKRLKAIDEAEKFVIMEGTIAARKRVKQCHSDMLAFIESHAHSDSAVDELIGFITEEIALTYVLQFYPEPTR